MLDNSNYGRIVNRKHFDRICSLIDREKVVFGGKINTDTLQIEQTIMDNITLNDAVMQQEIFDPIIPALAYKVLIEVYITLPRCAKALSLYIFPRISTQLMR